MRPYGRKNSLIGCSLIAKIVCGMAGGGFGVGVARSVLSDTRSSGVACARDGGEMSSLKEYAFVCVAGLAAVVLSGFG
jgi:hypothetical protein